MKPENIGLIFTFLLFVYLGVYLVAYAVNNHRCLEAGHRRAVTTYNLQGYCISSEGKVIKLNEKL